jgi:hypothetical protein
MHELVVIPSFQREPVLRECLKALRIVEPDIEVHVFSDKGYYSQELGEITWKYNVNLHVLPQHKYRGNNYMASEIFKWISKKKIPSIFYLEGDVIIQPGSFTWARQNVDSVFACCLWSNPTCLNQLSFLQYFSAPMAALSLKSVAQIAAHIKPNKQRPWDLQITDLLYQTHQFCLFPATRLCDHVGTTGLNFKQSAEVKDTGFANDYIPVKKLNPKRKPVLVDGCWRMR